MEILPTDPYLNSIRFTNCNAGNVMSHDRSFLLISFFLGSLKGATSRFVHLEKFSLNFLSLSFAIRVNLLHP